MRILLKKPAIAGLLAGLALLQPSLAADKPNIILCMADDLGWGDTGYNGSPVIQTPHLDEMAAQGVRFNRFYSASAVCSPTRASVLTGRHPHRTGVFFANTGILRPEEFTIAEFLKANGYATGHFGKWHLGSFSVDEKDANRGGTDPALFNPPGQHGFDTWFSTESKVPTWDPMLKPAKFTGKGNSHIGWSALTAEQESKPYGTAYWSPQGRVKENLKGDDSRVIMDRAIPFIREAADRKQPFLAVIWFHAPHLPCVAGPEFAALYKDQPFAMQQYAGCITAMDLQMGRLRKELKELGIEENTMLCFTSDNGPENGTPGSTHGLSGRKRDLLEGGIRVPGLMIWPKRVTKPMVIEQPACTSDYLPTVVEALGIPLPKDAYKLDGNSILPLLAADKPERKSSIGFTLRDQTALTQAHYKLYQPGKKKGEAAIRLYDITKDPTESTNLASEHPEQVKQMQKELNEWLQSCADSFHGAEYGKGPLERLPQQWPLGER